MHECLDCGQYCTCGGDIEDHDTGDIGADLCMHECEEYEEDGWPPEEGTA